MALACVACGGASAQTVSARGFPLGDLGVAHGGRTLVQLTVEIAATQKAREHGLMDVKKMGNDQGMVFLFPHPPVHDAFWMKDTLIPLDIVFWDAGGHIVDMQSMTPCTSDPCTIYYPRDGYFASVELNPGVLQRAGVQVGDTVTFTQRAAHPSPVT